jgi:GR25 family glycosyltransferase involved in LPS biosynthesis
MNLIDQQNTNIYRIEPSDDKSRDWIATTKGHIMAIEHAKEMDLPHIAIFEDDFVFNTTNEKMNNIIDYIKNLKHHGEIWDVILLSCNTIYVDPITLANNTTNCIRVYKGCSSAGYIVNKHYYGKLLGVFKKALELQEEFITSSYLYNKYPQFHIDNYWLPLQFLGKWFSSSPTIGKQLNGYRDITHLVSDLFK